jgi:hypothetical protein
VFFWTFFFNLIRCLDTAVKFYFLISAILLASNAEFVSNFRFLPVSNAYNVPEFGFFYLFQMLRLVLYSAILPVLDAEIG